MTGEDIEVVVDLIETVVVILQDQGLDQTEVQDRIFQPQG